MHSIDGVRSFLSEAVRDRSPCAEHLIALH
jgi:hypothetical protein